jgi:two-component system, chemotaxis family, CheB/CheR fusion protein
VSELENLSSGNGDLVVVGSSAGGIEALSILVSTLPANFPAPIVLAQHLDPNRPSSLDTILQRRTPLSVEVIHSRSNLQPGTIYVVPANHHVSIIDGHVEVQNTHPKRPTPSVDLLLSSAAEVYAERLIAVILTGSGSDGAAGAIEVKNLGGTVIVQDPQTARYPSMPLALPPTVIDFKVEIEQIGPLLYDLLNGVNLRQPEEKTEDVLRSILEQVSHQASIDFRPYKSSTILRRIGRRMTVTHMRSMRDYLEYLKTYPVEVGDLVKAFLINVTQFFRDPEAFSYLKKDILPDLITKARERDHTLRFWTAGCATGEEPYSLAMLIAEMLGEEFSAWNIKIFATDLDEAAITFARRGVYSETMLKGMPEGYDTRYFERTDHGYRISKMLRQMVIFGQQDLSRSAPFPRIDLVLCRNVLIYFTPELQEYVLNQFAYSLSAGGYLFLGKAETVRPLQTFYEMVNKRWKVYRCTGNALPSARRPNSNELHISRSENNSGRRAAPISEQHSDQAQLLSLPIQEVGQLRRFNEVLLLFLPMGVVVIDRSYRIVTANSSARRLLGLREIANEQDFLHAIRGIPYAEVRNAIDTVFRERNVVNLPEVELTIDSGGNGHFIYFSIAIMQLEAEMPDLAILSVTDVTEQVQSRRQLEAAQSEQTQLMHELGAANKRLNDMNKDLLDANEEFQVANEELMLTHEELQASIEEFETTNEELQATNEELETTNDELRARTSELQETTILLESERVRLAEMVELAPFYIMVLRGPNLIVEAFNPRYAKLLKGREIQGRPLEIVFELFWEEGIPIVRTAHEVYEQGNTRTTSRILTRLPNTNGEIKENYFVYTLVPSHDANGRISGVVIYAVDETEQRVKEIVEEREKLRLIFDHSDMAAFALYDAQTAELIIASSRYLDMVASTHDMDRSELNGKKWHDMTINSLTGEADRLWRTALETREPVHLPEVHSGISADKQESVWDYSLIPIYANEEEDNIRFIVVSAIDITKQVQARQELMQLNRIKDDFLSLASHELRTPLTSIMGHSELLQRNLKRLESSETPRPDFAQEVHLLDMIVHQSRRLNHLIEEMMDFTRIRSEQLELKHMENVNLVKLVRRVLEQYSGSNREITLVTREEEIMGNCDEGRLEQVLNNLISNAIKYSEADKPIEVRVERTKHEVTFAVRDEGRGISEEQQRHIFERFYRVHTNANTGIEGLGLGLYIAHEIVIRHGGRMWLESRTGQGSTFYFSLPLPKTQS